MTAAAIPRRVPLAHVGRSQVPVIARATAYRPSAAAAAARTPASSRPASSGP